VVESTDCCSSFARDFRFLKPPKVVRIRPEKIEEKEAWVKKRVENRDAGVG
jgi:hypothetical protein